jgi:hypothetical protein
MAAGRKDRVERLVLEEGEAAGRQVGAEEGGAGQGATEEVTRVDESVPNACIWHAEKGKVSHNCWHFARAHAHVAAVYQV